MCLGCTAKMKQALDHSLGNGSSSGMSSVGFWCMRLLSRCPCCVVCKLGGCFLSVDVLSPGKSGNALDHVLPSPV